MMQNQGSIYEETMTKGHELRTAHNEGFAFNSLGRPEKEPLREGNKAYQRVGNRALTGIH